MLNARGGTKYSEQDILNNIFDESVGTFGAGIVALGSTLAGEDIPNDVLKVEQRNSYNRISSATTTQVKTGAGLLHAIVVNTTAAGTIGLIDNTSGTTVNIGQLKSSITEGTYIYDLAFTAGLRIVTGAASDITVIYR
jgi:hypothetical protein